MGGFDQMTARLGGFWDSMLGEGRRWWVTANSDSHVNWGDTSRRPDCLLRLDARRDLLAVARFVGRDHLFPATRCARRRSSEARTAAEPITTTA